MTKAASSADLSERLGAIIAAHRDREGPLLPILHDIQAEWGFIPDEAEPVIAAALGLTRAEIHGVVSFYHDFRESPAGRHVLRVRALGSDKAVKALQEQIFPLAELITPNVPELEALSGEVIDSEESLAAAARKLCQAIQTNVLGKGGHFGEDANDVLVTSNAIEWYNGQRIDTPNTHGTGCTLSSAIASNLAKGYVLEEAVWLAKDYLTGALLAGLSLGKGHGPLHHGFALSGDFFG